MMYKCWTVLGAGMKVTIGALEDQNRSLQAQNRFWWANDWLLHHELLTYTACRSCEERASLLEDEMETAHQRQLRTVEQLSEVVVKVWWSIHHCGQMHVTNVCVIIILTTINYRLKKLLLKGTPMLELWVLGTDSRAYDQCVSGFSLRLTCRARQKTGPSWSRPGGSWQCRSSIGRWRPMVSKSPLTETRQSKCESREWSSHRSVTASHTHTHRLKCQQKRQKTKEKSYQEKLRYLQSQLHRRDEQLQALEKSKM